MKHLFMRCSIICLLLIMYVSPVLAETDYSNFYITLSDALVNAKQDNNEEAESALSQFAKDWDSVTSKETKEKQKVDKALENALNAKGKKERVAAIKELTSAVRALQQKENPVDETAQREDFSRKISPVLKQFENALSTGDMKQIEDAYQTLNTKWNQYERPVREQSMAMYGQIETQLSFIRMSIAAEKPDLTTIQGQYETMKQYIEDFITGKETAKVDKGDYSLDTLINYIDDALNYIQDKKYSDASNSVQQFIVIWPQVEQEVSTRNGTLYNKLESDMPIIASNLMKSKVDADSVKTDLQNFKTELELLQSNTNYSFWDSALILLREGLEALLIIVALAAFLKKSGQKSMEKWIYIGAGTGIFFSVVAAILMTTILNSANINNNRELFEGYVGLVAAAMMIGVGIWLHNKSNIQSWNLYISKQMNQAISTGSVVSMAFISFLSVFREGAETIVFYIGILPKMEISQFLIGIALSMAILVIVAVVLMKMSGKIPVHKFFAIATILIYILAFKIIGGSLHTLQLLGKLDTTVVKGLPVVSTVGLYPTVETLIGQSLLILLILFTVIYKRLKKENKKIAV